MEESHLATRASAHPMAAERPLAQVRRSLVLIWSCGMALVAASIALSWNGTPYWMDSTIYARSVAEGGWAIHPPGHLFFVTAGRLLYACGYADAYTALQVLTMLFTLGGVVLLYWLLRELVGPLESSILAVTFALSWVPLLMNHTGTSHASDFVTVPLLLLAAARLTGRPTRASAWALTLAIVLCGGFRLTTLIMMSPLLVAVLWVNRHNAHVWGAGAVGGLMVGLAQLLVVHASGGWARYFFLAEKTHFINRPFSVFHAGLDRLVLFNTGRSLLWFAAATVGLWFALFRLRSPHPWSSRQRLLLLYGALATLGPLAVCTLYLCEHPGYLAPALAGFYLCLAVAWNRSAGRPGFAKWPAVAIVASLLLFFGLRYYREPATRGQAIANSVLLQYSADAARDACYRTTTAWLIGTRR